MSIQASSWAWQLKIPSGMKLVLLALADHANDANICWPGIDGLADKCSLSRQSVIKHIKELVALDLVTKARRYNSDGLRTSNCYRLNLSQDTLHKETVCKDSHGLGQDSTQSYVNNFDPNHKEPLEEAKDTSSFLIRDIFQYWCEKMKHPRAKLDRKRQKLIKRALKDYSVEELKLAIDGCALSGFHMGQNDRKQKYDGLNVILRDAEQIEKFIDIAQNPPSEQRSYESDPLVGGI